MPRIIIGFTGSFGSGCTHIAENHLMPKGFKYISLSDVLKSNFKDEYKRDAEFRSELQDHGNKLRKENGPDFLGATAIETIKTQDEQKYWAIDSIKNPYEINAFRDYCTSFYLIGVFAEYGLRWSRKTGAYKGNQAAFDEDDKRDSDEDCKCGQRVRDCFAKSDLVILNNNNYKTGSMDYESMDKNIQDFLSLIGNPLSRPPSEEESLMSIAYASSLRSSCIKRKVGAVIVDKRGVILSSGCNEVPLGENPCKAEHGGCYRGFKKSELEKEINGIITDQEQSRKVKDLVLKNQKMLELCRALHAEENAILNIARNGSQVNLNEATLYTTTYPCNMCANKITQVGIGKIVYLEPYPQEEAKTLLDARRIKQKPFEGVSYKGFFRLFGSDNS